MKALWFSLRPKKKKCLFPLSRPTLAFNPRLKTFLKDFWWKIVYFRFYPIWKKNYSKFWPQKRLKQLLFSNQCNSNVLFQNGCMFPCVVDFNNALIVGRGSIWYIISFLCFLKTSLIVRNDIKSISHFIPFSSVSI